MFFLVFSSFDILVSLAGTRGASSPPVAAGEGGWDSAPAPDPVSGRTGEPGRDGPEPGDAGADRNTRFLIFFFPPLLLLVSTVEGLSASEHSLSLPENWGGYKI